MPFGRRSLLPALGLLAAVLASGAGAQQVIVLPRGAPAPSFTDLPDPPMVTALSPRTTILYADRMHVSQGPAPTTMAALSAGLVDAVVPASATGTGKPEIIQYALPVAPAGPVPLLVAWHGFGSSASSVSEQTTLDEECAARGWAYLAVTGIDDKLFGTPLAQQNVAAAIAWLGTQLELDEQRLYFVGFSMGGGCAASFAARHRDPDGPIVAALGTVSASLDWTQTWWLEPGTRNWLQNVWNFGATPAAAPFAYQRCSTLYHDPTSYPPAPGLALDALAMAQNLHATPTYVAWDTGDTVAYLPFQSAHLVGLLTGLGGTLQAAPVSGTVDPGNGQPATHSWAVLDEAALCDFLGSHASVPRPATVVALLDEERDVSWMHVVPRASQTFAWVRGEADANGTDFSVHDVKSAREVLVVPDAPAPWHLSGQAADATGFALAVGEVTPPAGYALDPDGDVATSFEFDPAGAGLLLPVKSQASFEVLPKAWDADLVIAPDPAPPGSPVTLRIDAADGVKVGWIVASGSLEELPFGAGQLLLVKPVQPFLLIPVPLSPVGDVVLQSSIPKSSGLSGGWVFLQAILQGPGPGVSGLSNPFRFDVQ